MSGRPFTDRDYDEISIPDEWKSKEIIILRNENRLLKQALKELKEERVNDIRQQTTAPECVLNSR